MVCGAYPGERSIVVRRRICIVGILAVFAVYCVLAFKRQAVFAVPGHRFETLAILGGATVTQWESPTYASKRHQRLNALENRRLHPAEPVELGGGERMDVTRVLNARDYERLALAGVRRIKVRDPAPLRAFAGRDLRLRNHVAPAADAPLVGAAGDKVTEDLLDRCLAAGITHIPVIGSGSVVGFNATVFMVILIFVGMTLTLTELFWEPVTALLDARRRELAEGEQVAVENARHGERIEAEQLGKRRQTRDAYQRKVAAAKRDAMTEANRILRHSQTHLRRAREDAGAGLHLAVREAGENLEPQVPLLAERLVEIMTGAKGESGGRDTGRDDNR